MARLPDLEQAQVPLLKDEAVPDSDDAAIVLGESESWTQRICKSRVAQGVTGLLMAVSLLGLLLYASGWTYPIPVPPVKEPETEPPLFLRNMPDVIADGTGNKWTGLQDNGLLAFYDIPYADSPVRFRRAQPYSGREFVDVAREAHWYPVGCSTAFMDGGGTDCLKLNIVIPSVQEELLPVILHIHGGGFINGYASAITPMDMMRRAAEMKKNFIFVAIDYRLGAMGLLAAPLDDGKAPRDLDLNVAFKDQLLAMEWVHKHIKHFGGDNSRITMTGESAGAISVGLHQLYSPHHLFSGAILLSGATTSFPVLSPVEASTRTLKTLNGTRCSSDFATPLDHSLFIDCLRALPEREVIEEAHRMFDVPREMYFPWYPVLEGSDGWLNERPSTKIARGDYNKMAIISGTSTDEGSTFTPVGISSAQGISDLILTTYGSAIHQRFEHLIPALLDLYPLGGESGSQGTSLEFRRAADLFGDLLFQAPNRFTLQQDAPESPRWGFSHEEMWPWYEPRYGVFHTSDTMDWYGFTANFDPQTRRAKECSTYLINFLHARDPNGPDLAAWPRYGPTRQLLAIRNEQTTVRTDTPRSEGQNFINRHLCELSL